MLAQAVNIALLHMYLGKNASVMRDMFFQLNYVQVKFPSSGSNVEIADKDRLSILTAGIFDCIAAMEASIREKAMF